jgi:hypothetical protein
MIERLQKLLEQIVTAKETLVINLNDKNVEAATHDSLQALADKVSQIVGDTVSLYESVKVYFPPETNMLSTGATDILGSFFDEVSVYAQYFDNPNISPPLVEMLPALSDSVITYIPQVGETLILQEGDNVGEIVEGIFTTTVDNPDPDQHNPLSETIPVIHDSVNVYLT